MAASFNWQAHKFCKIVGVIIDLAAIEAAKGYQVARALYLMAQNFNN